MPKKVSGHIRKLTERTSMSSSDSDSDFDSSLIQEEQRCGDKVGKNMSRLEQNRIAARESRKRKKAMIEELNQSVMFFSRANASLKQQNEELELMLTQARAQVENQTVDTQEGISHLDDFGTSLKNQTNVLDKQETDNVKNRAENNETTPLEIAYPPAKKIKMDTLAQKNREESKSQEASQRIVACPNKEHNSLQETSQMSEVQLAELRAQEVETQALFESMGYSPSKARAAARSLVPELYSKKKEAFPTLEMAKPPSIKVAAAESEQPVNIPVAKETTELELSEQQIQDPGLPTLAQAVANLHAATANLQELLAKTHEYQVYNAVHQNFLTPSITVDPLQQLSSVAMAALQQQITI